MSRIADALKQIKAYTWIRIPYLPGVERYIETGDPQALATVTPAGQSGEFWGSTLADALRPVEAWEDEDRRVVHVMAAAGLDQALWEWVSRQLQSGVEGHDVLLAVRRELELRGATEADVAYKILRHIRVLVRDGRPTSAGRWLLSLPPEKFKAQLKRLTFNHPLGPIAELITSAAPERTAELADLLLSPGGTHRPHTAVVHALLKHGGSRFEPNILAVYERCKDAWTRFHAACLLFAHDPVKFRRLGFDAARASLHGSSSSNNNGPAGEWLVEQFGEEAVPELVEYFRESRRAADASTVHWRPHWGREILDAAVGKLNRAAVPVLLAALDASRRRGENELKDEKLQQQPAYVRDSHRRQNLELRQAALQHLIAVHAGAHDDRIFQELRDGLTVPDASAAVGFLNLAARWDMARLEADVWGMLGHKSKAVREAAARALGRLGDAAVPKAAELLGHKKGDLRSAAVALLAAAATPKALGELERRLDDEPSDDVRDQMLLALAGAWEKQGRRITRQDVEARVAKAAAAGKLKDPAAAWADPANLPPLKWSDGGDALSRDGVAYLLYRQSRAKEIRPDVEAAPLYKLIDRRASGDFARAILRGFLGSKQEAGDRWALAVAGLLGDDRLVAELAGQIRDWVDRQRGRLAEWAVQALALLGTDTALVAVDALSIRYRTKMKNVGRAAAEAFSGAAEHLGISAEELGDRVVPWLGFEPGRPRVIEAGKTRIEATIGLDLKLAFKDLEKNKPVKSLPKSAPPEVLAEFKEISANLKEVVKAQLLRLENLLVRQRRWPAARWKELFLRHPLLLPFAVRLVWGHYDESGRRLGLFRALEDRSLTTREDEPYGLPDGGAVGMVHPLELDEAERLAWRNHLADYEIEPPFPQLEREVVAVQPEQAAAKVYRELTGTSINAMTFKGRAERLGWSRGSVVDAGGISSYYKSFPAAGVDVFLGTEGLYIGIDMDTDITLGDVTFVRRGTVKVGSYTYDEPSGAEDARAVALGEAPPVVFSQAMGDLQKIAGKKQTATEGGE